MVFTNKDPNHPGVRLTNCLTSNYMTKNKPVNALLQSEDENQVVDIRPARTGLDEVAQCLEKGIRIVPG